MLLCAAKKLPHTLVSYDVCYVLLSSTYKEPRFILVENEVSMFGILLLQNTELTHRWEKHQSRGKNLYKALSGTMWARELKTFLETR